MTVLEPRTAPSPPWKVRGAHLPPGLPVVERLLLLRGLPPGAERELFLDGGVHKRLSELLGDPFLLPDAAAAAARITEALGSGEPICVYGDYDADGVTATAVLVRGLRALGGAVSYYIPHRVDEGFGMNAAAVREIAASGARLIVTVDCGTSDVEEAALAGSLGMDIVITDHHQVHGPLPGAVAVVNPSRPDSRYPCRHLTGAGTAYTLLRAVAYRTGRASAIRAAELLQLVALGTIADVAPLTGENRLLVKAGLHAVRGSPLPGLLAVASHAGVARHSVNETDIAFKLAPRINAAGRMEHARTAAELLLEDDAARAAALALEIEQLNQQRRAATDRMIREALAMVQDGRARSGAVLMVCGDSWSPALLGIVAGKLMKEYCVPVVAATRAGRSVRASARSLPSLDISAALNGCAELLDEHGGHAQAAGFTTRPEHLDRVHEHLCSVLTASSPAATQTEVDLEIAPEELTGSLGSEVAPLCPFGHGNPEPLLGLRHVRALHPRAFGMDGSHLSFRVPLAGAGSVEVVGFGMARELRHLLAGPADLVVRPLRQPNGSYTPLKLCVDHIFPSHASPDV